MTIESRLIRVALAVLLTSAAVTSASTTALAEEFTLRKVRREGKTLFLYHDPVVIAPESRVTILLGLDHGGCQVEKGILPKPIRPEERYATLIVLDRGGTSTTGMGRYTHEIIGAVRSFLQEEIPHGNKDDYAIVDSYGTSPRTQPLTGSFDGLQRFLDESEATAPTAAGSDIYTSTEQGLALLEHSSLPLRATIVITDGYDPVTRTGADGPMQLTRRALAVDVPVFAILVNHDAVSTVEKRADLQAARRTMTKVTEDTFGAVLDTPPADNALQSRIRTALKTFSMKLGAVQRSACTLCGDVGSGGKAPIEMTVSSGDRVTWQSRRTSPGGTIDLAAMSGLSACACSSADDCPRQERCGVGACTAACTTDAQCTCASGNGTCVSGSCECSGAACTGAKDCASGMDCANGHCVAKSPDKTMSWLPYIIAGAVVALGLILWLVKRSRPQPTSLVASTPVTAPPLRDEARYQTTSEAHTEVPTAPPLKSVLAPTQDDPTLYCLVPENGDTSHSLAIGEFIAGADDDCYIRIDKPTVSSRHAKIEVSGNGSIFITDLGSSNGTYVNGARVNAQRRIELRGGDRIGLSKAVAFTLERTSTQPKATARDRTRLGD